MAGECAALDIDIASVAEAQGLRYNGSVIQLVFLPQILPLCADTGLHATSARSDLHWQSAREGLSGNL
jgi:hypothetical protein